MVAYALGEEGHDPYKYSNTTASRAGYLFLVLMCRMQSSTSVGVDNELIVLISKALVAQGKGCY